MADEACFVIDGVELPIPGLEGMNMQEAVVLYERSGLTLEDFAIDDEDPEQVEELARKTKHPGFLLALVQIAYMRGNPKVNRKRAETIADEFDLIDAYETIVKAGLDADPTSAPRNETTDESSVGNGASSGADSAESSDADSTTANTPTDDEDAVSDEPDETQPPTGTSE